MAEQSHQRLIVKLQSFSQGAAIIVMLTGLVVLIGWAFGLEALKGIVPGTVSMKANTAVCMVLTGLALLLGTQTVLPWGRRAAQVCVSLMVSIALVILSQYIIGRDLGIDQLLFKEPTGAVGTYNPGRMAPNTAFNFILDGIALLLLFRKSPSGYRWAQVISLVTGLIGLLAFIGYAYGIASFLGLGTYTQMAVNTALAFIVLSVGILFARPDHGLMIPIASPHAGGVMARRLALAVLTVPVALGLLINFGHTAWLYNQQVAASLVVVTSVLVLLMLVWFSAKSLNRTDVERGNAEQALRKREAQYRAIVEDQTELICRFLRDGTLTFTNEAFARSLDKKPHELIGSDIMSYIPEEEREDLQTHFASLTLENPVTISDRHSVMPDGEALWHQWTTRAIFDQQGRFVEYQSVGLDITQRKSVEEQLEHEAFHDALTKLPNRALFMDRLTHALTRARRNGNTVAVLFLDLDNFKVINDSLGHKVGDQLLITVSERLQTCVRPEDTVARLGGDEFTVLFEDVTELSAVTSVAERIAQQLQAPIVLGGHDQLRTSSLEGHEVFVSTSIGIALQASLHEHPDDLVRKADVAMYEAKSKGKARYVVYERNMTSRFREHLLLETELRRALEREELRVYYQPIVRLASRRIAELEALVRWQHPQRGLVPPAEFIPAAEETGLIVPLGRWVLAEACRQTLQWQRQYQSLPGDPPLRVSVNLSVRQFQHPQLLEDIDRIVRESGLDPGCLKLEITESVGIDDIESTSATLWKLKKLGLNLALDDFGTGYSALSYLKRYPFDTLKLDRAFIAGLGQNREDTAIVHAATAFAKALSLSVTAEGIETKEQLAELQKLGCDQGQGYYFAKPLPPDDVSALLAKQSQYFRDKATKLHEPQAVRSTMGQG